MDKKRFLDINTNPVKFPEKILTDNELVKIIRDDNPEMYQELISRYQGKLFAYLYRLVGNREETEDLLQDVFIKVYRNLRSYDDQRKFSSWIYRIAHNEAVNHIKRRYLKKFVSWEDINSTKDKLETSSLEDGPAEAWLKKETVKDIDVAISRLPLKYRQVLLLRYFSDKSYDEISEILGKPLNTVGTLINRAKKKLLEEVKNDKKFQQ
jgi:RNA polymerase sigma-70 factor, ECF subfamily